MYYGERKTGCRFLEITLHGYKSLIIENNAMRTILLLDKGASIISYVLKSTDTDFIWTNPMGLSCLEKAALSRMDFNCDSDNYIGGFFGIFPNVGGACNYKSNYFPNNSETAYLPWDYQILKDEESEMVFLFTTKLSKYPAMIKKKLIITKDSPALRFEEEIFNLGHVPFEYQWGVHPCFGAPFLNENCVLETPFAEDAAIPSQGAMEERLENYYCNNNGYGDVRDIKSGIGIGISWDTQAFPYCAEWISSGYSDGNHLMGGSYVTSLLPMNTHTFSLNKAAENGECKVLKPKETVTCWYTLTSFVKKERPVMINRLGDVV